MPLPDFGEDGVDDVSSEGFLVIVGGVGPVSLLGEGGVDSLVTDRSGVKVFNASATLSPDKFLIA